MSKFDLDKDLLMSISMDGPNVNKSFESKLVNNLQYTKGNSFISLDSCDLHSANNGFGEGMKKVKSFIDMEQFCIDMKYYTGRREDYKEIQCY